MVSGALVVAGAGLALAGAALARDAGPDLAPVYGDVPAVAANPAPAIRAVRPTPAVRPVSPTRARVTPGRVAPVAPVLPHPDRLPLRLRLPGVSTDAPVVAVGVRSDRSLVLPPPEQVGWWIGGAQPGDATGAVVLAGHVDAEDGRRGALYDLTSLRPGDTAQVDTTAGRTTYRVVAMRNFLKQHLPASVFDQRGAHRLVLITCGGSFEPGRGYARNVVAYAEPVIH